MLDLETPSNLKTCQYLTGILEPEVLARVLDSSMTVRYYANFIKWCLEGSTNSQDNEGSLALNLEIPNYSIIILLFERIKKQLLSTGFEPATPKRDVISDSVNISPIKLVIVSIRIGFEVKLMRCALICSGFCNRCAVYYKVSAHVTRHRPLGHGNFEFYLLQ